MRLADLDPEWVRWEDRIEPKSMVVGYDTGTPEGSAAWRDAGYPVVEVLGPVTYLPSAQSLGEAQGIEFDCPSPACARGHRIQVAFHGRGVLDHQGSRNSKGEPSRWQVVGGSSFEDLSLSPSIDCTKTDPACWHGHVTAGAITG